MRHAEANFFEHPSSQKYGPRENAYHSRRRLKTWLRQESNSKKSDKLDEGPPPGRGTFLRKNAANDFSRRPYFWLNRLLKKVASTCLNLPQAPPTMVDFILKHGGFPPSRHCQSKKLGKRVFSRTIFLAQERPASLCLVVRWSPTTMVYP